MMPLRIFHRLRAGNDGATVVEFAIVLPVLMTVLMGVFDLGYTMWATMMLQGSLQQAARASSLESASGLASTIDAKVTSRVQILVPNATLTYSRKAYTNFTKVGTAEDYTDTNANGACDANEPYEDANSNGSWDRDRGVNGVGGARDAVLYKVTMTYPRLLPMARMVGLSETVSVSASTVLRNQPFKLQASSSKIGNCK